MDDTKKIIERYKRELIEMSRASGTAKTTTKSSMSDNGNGNANNSNSAEKKPQVIGYVSGDSKAYDNFLEELGKMPEPESAPKSSQNEVMTSEDDGSGAEHPAPPEVIFEEVEAVTTPDNSPKEDQSAAEAIGNKRAAVSISDVDAPIFVTGSDGNTDEIIDETAPDGTPLFPQPNYIYIPSTEHVREDVTEQSDPADNRPSGPVSGVTNNSTSTPRPEQPSTVSVTTPEQAERLGKQPVSGTSPDEQLTGRSFEGIEPPPASDMSMWRGSRGEPASFPRSEFKDYEDFQKQNPGRGTLMFRVYTGRQAVPLEDAECVIYTRINGKKYEIAKMLTNSSGQTPIQGLPAPNKELSQHYENDIQAFALYDATVTKKGFSQVILEDIPVFDGVMSVQKVFMIVSSN